MPDLILLDIGLPGMSGVEALKQIKSRYPDVIVIMITAYEDVQTVVSAMKYGAYEYIVKPIQMDALLVILKNAFDYHLHAQRDSEVCMRNTSKRTSPVLLAKATSFRM